ncbi:hypothetical protein T10_8622 [Trichinella papuae]|uniref:Uncharacterized protein n=1 Tax=Trichinella papuae TaxID=268474 RepID=A0A0V1LXH5_9BILA|nr:hypothetical protein T10_8622 [Trichinella papuae]
MSILPTVFTASDELLTVEPLAAGQKSNNYI